MRISFTLFLFATVLLLTGTPSSAQTSSNEPLEITADTSLEWESTKKQYVAKGRATAKQGTFSVTGDTLTADYRDNAQGKSEIWQLTADGNVEIVSGTTKGYGDNAVYTVDEAKALMTGKDLRLEGEQLKITATERFEYYKNERRMVAVGSPVVTHGTDTLKADTITAWIADKNSPEGEKKSTNNLERAEAQGNVVITTPSETATGNRAVYHGNTNTAELLDNVKINRGPNVLEGARAEIDLTTKVSRIFGSDTQNGRVKGVFFPASEKGEKAATPAPAEPLTTPVVKPATATPVMEKQPIDDAPVIWETPKDPVEGEKAE